MAVFSAATSRHLPTTNLTEVRKIASCVSTVFRRRASKTIAQWNISRKMANPVVFCRAGEYDDILSRHESSRSKPAMEDRESHNVQQESFFDQQADYFLQPLPEAVESNLKRIVDAAMIKPGDNVLDCGAGSGPLIAHILECQPADLSAVDLSLPLLSNLKFQFDDVRCWHGDIVDLPSSWFNESGQVDVLFFNAMFGNVFSQKETLKYAISVARSGARVVISHPLGSNFVEKLKVNSPGIVPHSLPKRSTLEDWGRELGLEILEFVDEEELYLAVLKVRGQPDKFLTLKDPVFLNGPVVTGFGRGSRQMGVPTANLSPEGLDAKIEGLEKGVYLGFAQIPELDSGVFKMVTNVGNRPTFVDGEGVTIEVHIRYEFPEDFYGKEIRVALLGFIRPEMKFNSIDELVGRIRKDIQIAEVGSEQFRSFLGHPFFI